MPKHLVLCTLLKLSGYQDSNLGPPAPKAGALTGLRYTPKTLCGKNPIKNQSPDTGIAFKSGAKLHHFFGLTSFFEKKMRKNVVFLLFVDFLALKGSAYKQ